MDVNLCLGNSMNVSMNISVSIGMSGMSPSKSMIV